jgi:transcriptional regulator with XRE-family HTH domain
MPGVSERREVSADSRYVSECSLRAFDFSSLMVYDGGMKKNMARREVTCFRNNVATLCAEHGRIQEVADKAKISRVHLSRIINGHATPTIEIALQIADALGFSLTDLLSAHPKNFFAESA